MTEEGVPFIAPDRRLFSHNVYDSAQTQAVQLTPTAGRAVRLMGFSISTDATNIVDILVGGTRRWRFFFDADGGEINQSGRFPLFYAGRDETISITSSGGVNLAVSMLGYEEDI